MEGDWTFAGGYPAFADMLKPCDDPSSALFAANDMAALGSVVAARPAGLSILGELSVVGVDDISQRLHTGPRLTTVREATGEVATAAGGCLLHATEKGDAQKVKIIVPTPLVVRESTASSARATVLYAAGVQIR